MRSTNKDLSRIILFDGVCALCSASVHFIVDHDRAGHFQFAPIQSDQGQSLLLRHHLDPTDIHSVTLIESGRVYLRSTAALRICKSLDWPMRLLAGLVVIPRPLRDGVYDWIAKNRYRWFGTVDASACRIKIERA